jgi:hypothetical protein
MVIQPLQSLFDIDPISGAPTGVFASYSPLRFNDKGPSSQIQIEPSKKSNVHM